LQDLTSCFCAFAPNEPADRLRAAVRHRPQKSLTWST
jgi:hypothetical protein